MVVIANRFGIYVSPRNLDLSSYKTHCTLGEMPFLWGTWALLKGKFIVP
jgi:hypothetical protein